MVHVNTKAFSLVTLISALKYLLFSPFIFNKFYEMSMIILSQIEMRINFMRIPSGH